KILYTQDEIWQRSKEIAKQISEDYAGEELMLVGTLKGAILWMGDIMKNLSIETTIDFMVASSYGSGTTSSGVVTISKDIDLDLYGKNILLIEDIVDTGTTLKFLKEHLADRRPKSVKICTLLDKPCGRKADLEPDYVGFTVGDLFIVGYGLDYDQRYRDLPYISYLSGNE
ncbi:MAG TPA: hypoxanthine phosphoribosyltransferase, partial [Anaerovoracaceae bacterium]|nr:hypoxanthine phosphoribosyltransferase [Anaerovoracaceae bacterium]